MKVSCHAWIGALPTAGMLTLWLLIVFVAEGIAMFESPVTRRLTGLTAFIWAACALLAWLGNRKQS